MASENKLSISWKESSWAPHLTPHNVLAYFCQRSNPFYDKTCNNEIAKMQRLNANQLLHMKGMFSSFYSLRGRLHVEVLRMWFDDVFDRGDQQLSNIYPCFYAHNFQFFKSCLLPH